MAPTGYVRIRRVPRRAGRFCSITLMIDGQAAADLGNGQELCLSVHCGERVIHAVMQGVRSAAVIVQVTADEEVVLEAKAGALHWAQYMIPTGSIPMPRPLLHVLPEADRGTARAVPSNN